MLFIRTLRAARFDALRACLLAQFQKPAETQEETGMRNLESRYQRLGKSTMVGS